MKTTETPLSALANCWTRYPQKLTNIQVTEKKPFEELDGVLDLVKQAERALASEGGRVLLRYSGTEPKARFIGAPIRLSHRYDLPSCLDPLLTNRLIEQDYSVHGVENNLRLLDLIDGSRKNTTHDF